MSNQRIEALYNQRARLYQRFFVDFLGWEKTLGSFFEANNFLRQGMKVLDAGSGTGTVTKVLYHLARREGLQGITFHAFDLTPAMLNLFRQWIDNEGARGIEVRQGDVLALKDQIPQGWKDYDWIVSSAMLEYIPVEDRPKALCNLKEVLDENGRLLLFLTRRTRITRWSGAKWWGTNLFDQDEFTAELAQAGFTGIRFRAMPKGWDAYMMAVEARPAPRTKV